MVKYLFILFISLNALAEDFLFVEDQGKHLGKWTDFSSNSEFNVKRLINQLAKSPAGKELLRKAAKKASVQGETLTDIIEVGESSITDTTLIRRFTPESPEHVAYESKSKVFLNKDLDDFDAILDLAHELTHYVFRTDFNPYTLNFKLKEFISNTVEGEGGEVHAFMMECKVLNELFSTQIASRYNCKKIYDVKTGALSFEKARQEFYKVGPFYADFKKVLTHHSIHEHFPLLNNETPSFISSAYRLPYPVAAYQEYEAVVKKVCENDLRRMNFLKTQAERSPASVGHYEEFLMSFRSRCDQGSTTTVVSK